MELIYNLVDAMKKYSALSDCKLFQLVLDDKLSMDAWSDIANICKDIKVHIWI